MNHILKKSLNQKRGRVMASYKYSKIMIRLNNTSDDDMTVANILERFKTSQQRNKFIIHAILDYANNSGRDYVINQSYNMKKQLNDVETEEIQSNNPEEVLNTEKSIPDIFGDSGVSSDESIKNHDEVNNFAGQEEKPENIDIRSESSKEELKNQEVLEMILNKLGSMESGFNSKLTDMEKRLHTIEHEGDSSSNESGSDNYQEAEDKGNKERVLNEINTSSIQEDNEAEELWGSITINDNDEEQDQYEDIQDNYTEHEKEKNEFDMIDKDSIGGTLNSLFNLYNDKN